MRLVKLRKTETDAQRIVEELALECGAKSVAQRIGTSDIVCLAIVTALGIDIQRVLFLVVQWVGRAKVDGGTDASLDQRRLR